MTLLPDNKAATPLSIDVVFSDGKTYKLTFNALATIRLEEEFGINFLEGKFNVASAVQFRAFLWATLQDNHPELETVEHVGSLVHASELPRIMEQVMDLILGPQGKVPGSLAPFVPTPPEVIDLALEVAGVKEGDILYDLGCGDGRVLLKAAGITKARVVGYELDPIRAKTAAALLKQSNVEGRIHRTLLQESEDLDKADVVFLYLLTRSNVSLQTKLRAELRPGTRVVTHDFDMPGWTAKDTRRITVSAPSGEVEHSVYLYVMGEEK